jgi:hypothetical protein
MVLKGVVGEVKSQAGNYWLECRGWRRREKWCDRSGVCSAMREATAYNQTYKPENDTPGDISQLLMTAPINSVKSVRLVVQSVPKVGRKGIAQMGMVGAWSEFESWFWKSPEL